MDYVELFISLLQNPDLRLDALEQREALVVLANHCLGFIEGCDGEAKRNLVQLLGLVRPSVEASGVPAKLILIDCLLFQLTQQRAYFHQAISNALAEPHSDLGVQMATVIHLSRIAFVDAPGRL